MKFVDYDGKEITDFPLHTHTVDEVVKYGGIKQAAYPNILESGSISITCSSNPYIAFGYQNINEDSRDILSLYAYNVSSTGPYLCDLNISGITLNPNTKYIVYLEYINTSDSNYEIFTRTGNPGTYGDFKLYSRFNTSDQISYISSDIYEEIKNAESKYGKLKFIDTSSEINNINLNMVITVNRTMFTNMEFARVYFREVSYASYGYVTAIADENTDGFMDKMDKLKIKQLNDRISNLEGR